MILAVHKPYGVLSQFNVNPDYPDQRTLGELGLPPEMYVVGRLDRDSEGLLLLTDEKDLERQLLHPEVGHSRAYMVQVDGSPSEADLSVLRRGGLEIRGYSTQPCRVKKLRVAPPFSKRVPAVDPSAEARSCWLEMILREGKNRQVRRMTAKIGCPTLRLVRVRIGALELGDLAVGEWRMLSEQERALLFQK